MNDSKQLSVRDFMSGKAVSLQPDMDVVDAVKLLLSKRISGAPVVDERGNLVGMLTERDVLKHVVQARYHDELGAPVSECMSPDVETVDIDENLMYVAARFAETKFRRYPVVDENRLVGVIHRQDVLKAILELS